MTKKNILAAAIAAFIASVSTISATGAVNAASCAETDPAYCEETETLGPPICIMENERIPEEAWDALKNRYDIDHDGTVRVADAIKAKKAGDDIMSSTICRYIINDNKYEQGVTLSPASLSVISDDIRRRDIDLLSVWRTEQGEAFFMLFSKEAASPFILETCTSNEEMGFTRMWDRDGDQKVTEKDAASIYLDNEDEDKALAASSYAQFGTAEFAACAVNNEGYTALKVEEAIEGINNPPTKAEIVYVDYEKVCVYDYDGTVIYIY